MFRWTNTNIIYVFILLFANSLVFSQNNILVIDYNNAFTSDQSNNSSRIYNRLVATQASVVRVNAIPATINPATYNQVWIFGDMGTPTAANQNPIINYMNAGGAVYIQSEVGCCYNQAAYVDDLINATVIAGGSITHSTTLSGYYETIPTSTTCTSSTLVTYGAAVRPFQGTPAANVMFTSTSTCGGAISSSTVVGAKFRSCDMISGKGALISIGDFNVFPASGTCTGVGILGTTNDNLVIDYIADLLPCLITCSTLPVTLTSFEVECQKEGKKISWTTSSEINNDYFTIEKSVDALNWEIVSHIQGAGNSNQLINYSYIDESYESNNQTIYYRLKQTDFDGNFEYFNVLPIKCEGATSPIIFPNPVTSTITISGKEINKIEIIDVLGRIVKRVISNAVNETINVSDLSNGTYVVKVYETNKISNQKIIKQ